MAKLSMLPVLAFMLAITLMYAQVTIAVPTLDTRQVTCAVIPGLTDSNVARSLSLLSRAAVDGEFIDNLILQDAPCIPNTIDVSPITKSVARVQAQGEMQIQGLFGFLKGIWKVFQDVLKVVKDITQVVLYGDVVNILQLLVDGYQLFTDVKNTFLIAKGPNGVEKKFLPVRRYRESKEIPCGGRTGRICPKY